VLCTTPACFSTSFYQSTIVPTLVENFLIFQFTIVYVSQAVSSIVFPPQPIDAVFPNSYRQPEDCEQDECDFYVEWRNNDKFVDFRMEGNASGWITLGLSGANTPLNMVSVMCSDL